MNFMGYRKKPGPKPRPKSGKNQAARPLRGAEVLVAVRGPLRFLPFRPWVHNPSCSSKTGGGFFAHVIVVLANTYATLLKWICAYIWLALWNSTTCINLPINFDRYFKFWSKSPNLSNESVFFLWKEIIFGQHVNNIWQYSINSPQHLKRFWSGHCRKVFPHSVRQTFQQFLQRCS